MPLTFEVLWDIAKESETLIFIMWLIGVPLLLIVLVWLYRFVVSPYPLTEDTLLMSEEEKKSRRASPRLTMLEDLLEGTLDAFFKPLGFLLLLGIPLLALFLIVKLIKWMWLV